MQPPPEFEIARRLPRAGCTIDEARDYTRWLATHHYENFNVVSRLLPRELRQGFYDVYAYCRWADDLGDEVRDTAQALSLLGEWEDELRNTYAGRPTHPVFIALEQTVRRHDIPIEPFTDLLRAFRQDQSVTRYHDWQGVHSYCRYSANPVGRLVLYLCGVRDADRQALSDCTCTALQLANFWQDVSRDLDKGRIYIPLDRLHAHGLTENDLFSRRFVPHYADLMKELIAYTRELFSRGVPLARRVPAALRVDVELFSRGGLAVLEAIERIGYNTIEQRPALSRLTQARLLGRALLGRLLAPALASPSHPGEREISSDGPPGTSANGKTGGGRGVPLERDGHA